MLPIGITLRADSSTARDVPDALGQGGHALAKKPLPRGPPSLLKRLGKSLQNCKARASSSGSSKPTRLKRKIEKHFQILKICKAVTQPTPRARRAETTRQKKSFPRIHTNSHQVLGARVKSVFTRLKGSLYSSLGPKVSFKVALQKCH